MTKKKGTRSKSHKASKGIKFFAQDERCPNHHTNGVTTLTASTFRRLA